MPFTAGTTDPATPVLSLPGLRIGDERCALPPGTYVLGGRGADTLALRALDRQPRAATITVSENGTTTLQRTTASIVVRLNGDALGVAPAELHDGAVIELGECRLVFVAATRTPTAPLAPTRRHGAPLSNAGAAFGSVPSSRARPNIGASESASATIPVTADAALVDVRSGARHPLPARRIFIGRDDSCDVVVRGSGVSRRHASIAPVGSGFMLRDESANGTLVNGVRVVGTYLLGEGDVVRLHEEELRVELGASTAPALVGGEATALLDISHITRDHVRSAAPRVLTASLEIVRGQFAGASFQVDRAVCSIGRGEENDVRIRDDTVSSTHASLLRKGDAWFVVDLRSMNGTFVDGSRVSGEREIHAGSRVRVGAVELVFRAIDGETAARVEPPRPRLWARLSGLLRSVAPPTG